MTGRIVDKYLLINCRIYISSYPFQNANAKSGETCLDVKLGNMLNKLFGANWTKYFAVKSSNYIAETVAKCPEHWFVDKNDMCSFISTPIYILLFLCFVVIRNFRAARWQRTPNFNKILSTVPHDTCTLPSMLKVLVIFLIDIALFPRNMRQIIPCERFENFVGRPFSILKWAFCVVLLYNFWNPTLWDIDSTSSLYIFLWNQWHGLLSLTQQ